MMTKRIFLALTFTAIVAVSATVAQAQSTDTDQSATQHASGGGILDVLDRIKQAQAQQLEGSWVVTVTPVVPPGVPQPPSFRAYSTFARGGAFIGKTPAGCSTSSMAHGRFSAAMNSPYLHRRTC